MKAVVLSIDDCYLLQLQVFAHTLYQNNSIPADVRMFILHEDSLSRGAIDGLTNFLRKLGYRPEFIHVTSAINRELRINIGSSDHVSRATYYRLYCGAILPPEIDFVVYLDVDAIIMRSIRHLFSIDLGDHPLAAADHLDITNQLRLWGPQGGSYFNAGVLIINLKQWRSMNVVSLFHRILDEEKARIRWHDQDVLNLAFANQWKRLSILLNVNHVARRYLKEEDIIDKAYYMHYSGSPKAWRKKNLDVYDLLWYKALGEVVEYMPSQKHEKRLRSLGVHRAELYSSRQGMMGSILKDHMVVAEIGVFEGSFSEFLRSSADLKKLYLIDLFEGNINSGDQDGRHVRSTNLADVHVNLQSQYADDERVSLIKCDSGTFLASLPDDSLDVIYIDGDHSYKGCKSDLEHAYNKVKSGGYICGHDYSHNPLKAGKVNLFGVKKAVDEFCRTRQQVISAKGMDGCVSYAIKLFKP